jgi:hypothetical protein
VEKIIIFQRQLGSQALVQFKFHENALNALKELNGKSIYLKCNNMKIQFSGKESIEIQHNNDRSWDYTKTNATVPASGSGGAL